MKSVALSFSVLLMLLTLSAKSQVEVFDLKCEQLNNPIGIECLSPRLSWKMKSSARGVNQFAYQVLVASSLNKLNENDADVWNSKKVQSNQSQLIEYAGEKLKSTTNYYWKVKVWTSKGESGWSEPAQWSMGLISYKDWRARWIGFDRAFPWDDDSFHSRLSARYLRKEIELNEEIQDAKVYIIGLGLYEFELNGKKVGESVLAPSPTDYHKNIKYNVYDVTSQLLQGKNALGVILGNGRYYTMRQHYKGYKIKDFGFPKLLFQLEITYVSGKKEYFRSDNSWRATAQGPIISNNEYDGEDYDARKELTGWSEVGYDDSWWLEPEYVEQPEGAYQAQLNPNMKVLKEVKPISIVEHEKGKYILDLGQNIAGWLQLKVKGESGNKVTMRFGEILNEDGSLFTTNLRDAKQEANYTLKGGEQEIWEPRFVYYGFRYVEITGYPTVPTVNDFVGKVVSDDMDTNGLFQTSNTLINQLYKNAYWGILGNYKGMPVDCPQRNERQPWLGDRTTGCYGESFIFDNVPLYKKWTDDIAYSQMEGGEISDVAPAYWRYYSDNMSWCGTWLMVADMIYQQAGDAEPIIKHYQGMKKWLNYMANRYGKDYIITKDSYGDWCIPPVTIEEGAGKSADKKRPSELISTAYYYHYLQLMQEFAKLSGNNIDIKEYEQTASKVKASFNAEFYNNNNNSYGNLTDNLLAVGTGLAKDREQEVLNTIEKQIKDYNNHLSCGVVGMQWLMRTLARNGYEDLAWTIATNTTYPSWGYMIENGATTIWELWNGNTAHPKMNSYNHVMMLGDLIIWMYEDLAGIRTDREEVAFKKIIMKPTVVGGLDYVEASHQSVYGTIKSSWTKKKNKFTWDITIPANTSAEVYLPASSKDKAKESGKSLQNAESVSIKRVEGNFVVLEIESGTYQFQSQFAQ